MSRRGFQGRSFCTTSTWPGGCIPIELGLLANHMLRVRVVHADVVEKFRAGLEQHIPARSPRLGIRPRVVDGGFVMQDLRVRTAPALHDVDLLRLGMASR